MTRSCPKRSLPQCVGALIVMVASVGTGCSSDTVINVGQTRGGTVGSGGTSIGSGGPGTGGTSSSGGTSSRGGEPGFGGLEAGGVSGTGGVNAGGAVVSGGSHAGGTNGGTGSAAAQDGGQDATASGGSGAIGGAGGSSTGTGGSRLDASPDSSSVDDGGNSTYNPCPASGACAILPLGDSITWGFGSSGADGGPKNEGGYRIELFRQTVTNAKNIDFVGSLVNGPTTVANKPFPRHNEGHGGFTIAGIAAVVRPSGAPALLTTYKPDIVLLKIGTNDVNGNNDLTNAPTRLANLINTITTDAPSALVVVSTIIPILNDSTNVRVQTYNAAIPGVVSKAAAAGKHVIFADAYAAFVRDASWKTKLMFDNLHPNDAGYVVLGQMWYAAIKSILPTGP